MEFHRGTSADSGRGLAICEGAHVVAIVQGGGYPIGKGNCPQSDRVANLFEASPALLEAARDMLAEIDGDECSASDFLKWEAAKNKLRDAVNLAERVTFNTANGWDGAPVKSTKS